MTYDKPTLSLEEQAQLLKSRGMNGDIQRMVQLLHLVSYHRMKAYWRIFLNSDDMFMNGVSFDDIWHIYAFDRRLRLLVMDAVERIEVTLRAQLAYHHSNAYGPFGYVTRKENLPNLGRYDSELLHKIRNQINANCNDVIMKFKLEYGSCHNYPPIWMTVEVISFGALVNLYRSLPNFIKQQISDVFGVSDLVFDSWLMSLRWVRNTCAHHGRLWNVLLPTKPMIPRQTKYRQWHTPQSIENTHIFAILTICKWCLDRIAPSSSWYQRVLLLVSEFPDIPYHLMGFPDDWRCHDMWRFINT